MQQQVSQHLKLHHQQKLQQQQEPPTGASSATVNSVALYCPPVLLSASCSPPYASPSLSHSTSGAEKNSLLR